MRLRLMRWVLFYVICVGFMGSLLFKDEEKLNKYISLKIKPSSILEDITYPKGYVPKKL